jgi:hypothetical protein
MRIVGVHHYKTEKKRLIFQGKKITQHQECNETTIHNFIAKMKNDCRRKV